VTPPESDLVRFASEAVAAHGLSAKLVASSTDANFPMSLGIPSLAMASGQEAENGHSLDEFIVVDQQADVRAMAILLTTVVALAQAR
jgi:acetylornithine deacetylase/succinyl-diaminopimelate desuccinylase-like protein